MASLTETAYQTRRGINWLILAIILYIILRLFWGVFIILWLTIFPPKPPPPDHRFGKLPIVHFPPQEASPSGGLTFKLETIEGSVPKASDSAVVFFMNKPEPNLLALSQTQDFAQRLGLSRTPIAESKNIYKFEDQFVPLRKLRYDIISRNFVLSYDYTQDSSVFVERNIPSDAVARSEAVSALQSYALYKDDLERGSTAITYLKLFGNQLLPTTSLSTADAIRVDFFRRTVAGIKIFTKNPAQGQVFFIFSGSVNVKKHILTISYTLWPIAYDTYATYSLKSSSQAWEELQSGKGYIARYPTSGNVATVRNAYLGYFEEENAQTYLQPVFVFEGDNGFLGYVPAVSDDWVAK